MKLVATLLALAVAVAVASPVLSQDQPPVLTDEQTAELGVISASLSAVRTLAGDFVQFGPNGERTEGRFYMKRPGRIRFQYAPPNTISVISDGDQVLIHDKALQTYDLMPLKRTPLKFLLDDEIDLASAEQLAEVYVAEDLVQVLLVDDSRFGGGTLALFFDRATSELRQWSVIDQQGLETSVAIYNVESGIELDDRVFDIDYSAAAIAAREKNN